MYQVQFLGKKRTDIEFTLIFDGQPQLSAKEKQVYHVDERIRIDDTVEIIKLKILKQISQVVSHPTITIGNVKSNDLYLFYHADETLNMETLRYQIVIENDGRTTRISYEYAYNFLATFGTELAVNLERENKREKTFTVDEILERIPNKNKNQGAPMKIVKQLGQHETFLKIGKKSIAIADPYLNWNHDENMMLKPVNRNPYMLLDSLGSDAGDANTTANINIPTIFCCWYPFIDGTTDVVQDIKRNWYFPLHGAAEPSVSNIERMQYSIQVADKLYETTASLPSTYLNPFYFGVEQFHFTYHPAKPVKFPLFILFKWLEVSEQYPLIKYNPRKKMQKMALREQEFVVEDDNEKSIIYKLYSENKTASGEKVPVLAKENINAFILHREVKSLTIYLYKVEYKNRHYYLACEIQANGNLSVYSVYPQENIAPPLKVADVYELVQVAIGPIIEKIKEILKGFYKIDLGKNLYASNITVNSLTFAMPYNKTIKKGLQSNASIQPLIQSLVQSAPVKELDAGRRKSKKFIYTKISKDAIHMPDIGFPVVYDDNKMTIAKITNLYYLDVLDIYFNALFYMLGLDKQKINLQLDVPVPVPISVDEKVDDKDVDVDVVLVPDDYGDSVKVDDEEDDDEEDDDIDSLKWKDDDDDNDDDDEDGDVDDLLEELGMFGGRQVGDKNPFVSKMKQFFPDLFKENIHEENPQVNKYSRTCQNKEPLLLTTSELNELKEKQYPLTKKEVLKYGKDLHGNSLYFTCPKYYCMKEGQEGPITAAEIESGKCGPITNVADAVFTDIRKRGDKHVYHPYKNDKIDWYPAFNSSRLQNGFCSPCCFKKISQKQEQDKKTCEKSGTLQQKKDTIKGVSKIGEDKDEDEDDKDGDKDEDKDEDEDEDEEDKEEKEEKDKDEDKKSDKKDNKQKKNITSAVPKQTDNIYILSSDSPLPMPVSRWGYPPTIVQQFLNNNTSMCSQEKNPSISSTSRYECFLRHGVENSPNKSFVALLSRLLFYKDNRILGVPAMCQYLADHIQLDDFMTAQNGNLFAIFNKPLTNNNNSLDTDADLKLKLSTLTATDITTKYNSKLFSDADLSNRDIHHFIMRVMYAFERFRAYLLNPDSHIDYTYLWDIMSSPNPHFFKDGANFCILQMNQDGTELSMVCPTNFYIQFNRTRPIYFILESHDHYFEPLSLHQNRMLAKRRSEQAVYEKFIYNSGVPLMRETQLIPKVVEPIFNKCSQNTNVPSAIELATKNWPSNYTPHKIVMNFVGQIVGLMFRVPHYSRDAFVPCLPSSSLEFIYTDTQSLSVIFINELSLLTYNDAILFYQTLLPIYERFKLPLTIRQILDEDKGDAVGLYFQEYHFFVPFKSPQSNKKISKAFPKEINPEIADMYKANVRTQLSSYIDEKRRDYILRIKLATQLYNKFKNVMRDAVLNLPSNKYDELRELCMTSSSSSHSYLKHLERVKKMLEQIGTKSKEICFVESDDLNLYADQSIFASASLTEQCKLLLPKHNLLEPTTTKRGQKNKISDNQNIYYIKLADELIRFKQLSQLFFNKKQFVLYQSLEQDARNKPHEIILLESQLLYNGREYLKNIKSLQAQIANPYIIATTYNTKNTLPSEMTETKTITRTKTKDANATSVNYEELMKQPVSAAAASVAADAVGRNIQLTISELDATADADVNKEKAPKISTQICRGKPESISTRYISTSKCFENVDNYVELNYDTYPQCRFILIADLIHIFFGETYSVDVIKQRLISMYERLLSVKLNHKYVKEILTQEKQAKEFWIKIKDGAEDIVPLIMDTTFEPTLFDIWMLLVYFKIPSVFVSKNPIAYNAKRIFVCYTNDEGTIEPGQKLVFIDVYKAYKLISRKKTSYVTLTKEDILHSVENCIHLEPPTDVYEYVRRFPEYKLKVLRSKEKIVGNTSKSANKQGGKRNKGNGTQKRNKNKRKNKSAHLYARVSKTLKHRNFYLI